MRRYLPIYYSLSLAVVFLLLATHVRAQQAQGLNVTVSPTVIEVSDSPGKTIEGKFRIRNNSTTPVTLSLQVDKLSPNEDGTITPATARKEDTFISWTNFEKTTITAAPLEWTDIPYTIKVPDDAAFGYYYAIRITQRATPAASDTTVLGEVVIPLLLDVKNGTAKREMKLIDFKPTHFINELLPVSFITTVENTGNIHSKPRGNIFIRGVGEKDLALLEVNEGLGNVLPTTKRNFISNWTDGFLVREEVVEDGAVKRDDKGNPVTQLKFNWNKLTDFRIGKYTATLLLVYDNGERDVALEKTTSFWVIPYTAIAVALIAIFLLIFIIRFALKSYVQGQIKKSQNKN